MNLPVSCENDFSEVETMFRWEHVSRFNFNTLVIPFSIRIAMIVEFRFFYVLT